jgi:hypothetical protein
VFVKKVTTSPTHKIKTVEDDDVAVPAPSASPSPAPAPRTRLVSGFASQLEAAKAAKRLAEELGGVDELIKVLELLD